MDKVNIIDLSVHTLKLPNYKKMVTATINRACMNCNSFHAQNESYIYGDISIHMSHSFLSYWTKHFDSADINVGLGVLFPFRTSYPCVNFFTSCHHDPDGIICVDAIRMIEIKSLIIWIHPDSIPRVSYATKMKMALDNSISNIQIRVMDNKPTPHLPTNVFMVSVNTSLLLVHILDYFVKGKQNLIPVSDIYRHLFNIHNVAELAYIKNGIPKDDSKESIMWHTLFDKLCSTK